MSIAYNNFSFFRHWLIGYMKVLLANSLQYPISGFVYLPQFILLCMFMYICCGENMNQQRWKIEARNEFQYSESESELFWNRKQYYVFISSVCIFLQWMKALNKESPPNKNWWKISKIISVKILPSFFLFFLLLLLLLYIILRILFNAQSTTIVCVSMI